MFWVSFVLLFSAISYFTTKQENVCIIMRDFFLADVTNGVIVEKYIDSRNHAIRTIIIEASEKRYKVLFIHYDNWNDFDRLSVGDTLEKPLNSFKFLVKNGFTFELQYDCDYSSN